MYEQDGQELAKLESRASHSQSFPSIFSVDDIRAWADEATVPKVPYRLVSMPVVAHRSDLDTDIDRTGGVS